MASNKIKVLIVESSRLLRDLLAELMKKHGFEVASCANGSEALGLSQKTGYNLICIAYHLPDFSGEMLCQELRSNPVLKNSRIILFTGEDNAELLKGALLAGATDIYNKNEFSQFQTYIERFAQMVNHNLVGNALLIEDSISQQHWLKAQLESAGLNVEAFQSAEEAMQAFLQHDYDIVITDMILAGNMSGLNLVRAIRRLPSEKGLTPVFAITAYDEISRRIELFQVGVSDYMAKPINPEELLFRVASLIKSQQVYRELAAEQQALQEMAMLDPVTKLYNRTALNQLLPKLIANAQRDASPVSLALMDLDYFKKINDTYGHDEGDRVLMETGNWLRNSFRKGDLVFRWGGEEFVIFLNHCDMKEARTLIEKQREQFNQRKIAGHAITASFGISSLNCSNNETSHEALFKLADQALYQAKLNGRNCVVCAQSPCP